jgi:hypothetical protein
MDKALLKELLINKLNEEAWYYQYDDGCRHGCCPSIYSSLNNDIINTFADEFINELEYREANNG